MAIAAVSTPNDVNAFIQNLKTNGARNITAKRAEAAARQATQPSLGTGTSPVEARIQSQADSARGGLVNTVV